MPRLLEPELRGRVTARLHELGYRFVTLDLDGFRSGSMNPVSIAGKAASQTLKVQELVGFRHGSASLRTPVHSLLGATRVCGMRPGSGTTMK